MIRRIVLLLAVATALQAGATAQVIEPKPKLASGAVPLLRPDDFLRSQPAQDFWSLLPFYVPQATEAACSIASITIALNALRGLPSLAADPIITQERLLERVADARWLGATARGGSGVTWAELEHYLGESIRAYAVQASVEVWRPDNRSELTLQRLREMLAENEQSSSDIIIGVFDQGVLTGDVNIGHVSPIGAYDQKSRRVLVLDTDREWYVPYWVSDERLLEAMLKPGPQDSERGGLLRVRRNGIAVN
jgi:hypothetical protein